MTNPVLQLLPTPYRLNRSDYRNAYSPVNPNGDMRAAYALRSLVNPIPRMARDYAAGDAMDSVWGLIINNATAPKKDGMLQAIISQGRQDYEGAALQDLSIAPGQWWPLQAQPDNWMAEHTIGFRSAEINLTTLKISGLDGSFQYIANGRLEERVHLPDGSDKTQPMSAAVSNAKIRMKVLEVSIQRDWMAMTLLETGGWHLSGEPAGYVSDGKLDSANRGILPLVPTAFLVGVEAALEPADAGAADAVVSIGPFDLAPSMADGSVKAHKKDRHKDKGGDDAASVPDLYLIGMISTPVIRMPTMDGT